MNSIDYIAFISIMLGLMGIIVLLLIFHRKDTKDLRDRIMSKDFHDYSVGQVLQKAKPKVMTDAEQVEEIYGITKEDKEQVDRLPVS